eukprot:UN00884
MRNTLDTWVKAAPLISDTCLKDRVKTTHQNSLLQTPKFTKFWKTSRRILKRISSATLLHLNPYLRDYVIGSCSK